MISECKKAKIKWAIVALSLTLITGCSTINVPINSAGSNHNQSASSANSQSDTKSPSPAAVSGSIVYKNTQYGFNFTLPKSWQSFSIITESWEGYDAVSGKVSETGPMISIRHPLWTSENPRQDIPVMIFTIDQWNLLQKEKFHIGAAPIGPGELGRNNKYVFALPARYNYSFLTGYQEVEQILKGHPLQPVMTIDSTDSKQQW